jgi:hypothetical protein
LFVEVLIEWRGSKTIPELIAHPPVPWLSNILFGLFVVAVAYLLLHHYEESKKPGYEYKFVQKLTQFMQGDEGTIDALIPVALKLFYEAFERASILHCSVYQVDGNLLKINEEYVYPKTSDPNYFIPLRKGEGVAGLVCEDKKSRYVPRVFFPFRKRWRWVPTFFFPHAVMFDFNRVGDDLELIHRGLDVFVFKGSDSVISPFQSFVSVPLKSASQEQCFGILNFDFLRSDPLDRSDIAMAALFGLILGGEIERLQKAPK